MNKRWFLFCLFMIKHRCLDCSMKLCLSVIDAFCILVLFSSFFYFIVYFILCFATYSMFVGHICLTSVKRKKNRVQCVIINVVKMTLNGIIMCMYSRLCPDTFDDERMQIDRIILMNGCNLFTHRSRTYRIRFVIEYRTNIFLKDIHFSALLFFVLCSINEKKLSKYFFRKQKEKAL